MCLSLMLLRRFQAAFREHPFQMMGGGLSGVHQRHLPSHELTDHGLEQRIMGAAQNEGIHPGIPHLGQVLCNDQLRHLLPALLAVVHITGFHQRNEQRTGPGGDLHTGHQLAQQLFIAAGADGRRRANNADAAVAGGKGRFPGGGIHHPQIRHRQPGRLCSRVGAGHRAAGRHDALYIFRKQERNILTGVLQDCLRAAAAVGHAAGITKIDDFLVGQTLAQLPHAGQPAQTAVEHADGAIIHAAFPFFPEPVRSAGR